MKRIVLSALVVLLGGLAFVNAKPTKEKKKATEAAAAAPAPKVFLQRGAVSVPIGYLVAADDDAESKTVKANINPAIVVLLREDGTLGWAYTNEVLAQWTAADKAAANDPKK